MRKIIVLMIAASLVTGFTGCKKAIQAAEEKKVVNAITSGVWIVTKFTQAGTDVTADFSGWEFTYYDNGTCVANKTGNTAISGTWGYNIVNTTTVYFTAAFTGTAPAPLPKLASTWLIVDVASDSKASYSRTEAGVDYKLELSKK